MLDIDEMIEWGKKMDDRMDAYDWYIPVKKGGMSNCFFAVPFQGCELAIDPEFKTLTIYARGYQIEVDWGNTKNWTAPYDANMMTEDDVIAGAFRMRVVDEDEINEDGSPKVVVDWKTVPDKGVVDEDYKVVDESNPHTGIWKAGSVA
tara:strand:- start:421 stop:864 length:444 start_codon:yes stop_codon:yes gene_type:complete